MNKRTLEQIGFSLVLAAILILMYILFVVVHPALALIFFLCVGGGIFFMCRASEKDPPQS